MKDENMFEKRDDRAFYYDWCCTCKAKKQHSKGKCNTCDSDYEEDACAEKIYQLRLLQLDGREIAEDPVKSKQRKPVLRRFQAYQGDWRRAGVIQSCCFGSVFTHYKEGVCITSKVEMAKLFPELREFIDEEEAL